MIDSYTYPAVFHHANILRPGGWTVDSLTKFSTSYLLSLFDISLPYPAILCGFLLVCL